MPKILNQRVYTEPGSPGLLSDEPLVLHARSIPSRNRNLIIFVHGLGGRRYGKNTTWGNFPRFVFEDLDTIDVGMYEYRTAFGRIKFWESIDLEDEARVFADILRDLNTYDRVVLIGHSMGGLLAKAAIAYLLQTNQAKSMNLELSLVLMATPQTGSQRLPKVLNLFSRDARVLSPHNKFLAHIDDVFSANVVIDGGEPGTDQLAVPTWAILGSSDFWVDRLSAGIGLPPNRKKTIRGSHVRIVKPARKQTAAYEYVMSILSEVMPALD
ncbi:MAG: alpha/beta hydrolase [Pirellula sp.]|jgi:pimeloyl-ACP methyl ester carboxylesterase|nr:alpha/beta hydrolase [Pirellula sp.]